MVSYGLCYSNLSYKNLGEEIVFSDVKSNFNYQPDGQGDADSERKTNDSWSCQSFIIFQKYNVFAFDSY